MKSDLERQITKSAQADFYNLSVEEVFKDVQADIAGLFRVKLRGENISMFNGGGDFFAVSGGRGDNILVVGAGVIAVHEIKIRLAAQARKKFGAAELNGIPAHVRYLQIARVDSLDGAAKNFQTVDARAFFTARE